MADVIPTRMELLKTKERIVLAGKGHKLLKQKRDALILEFFKILKKSQDLRGELARKMEAGYQALALTETYHSAYELQNVSLNARKKIDIDIEVKNIMGVKIPNIESRIEKNAIADEGYAVVGTSSKIDAASERFEEILQLVIKLAETETAIKKLIVEIEKTKRRVNALEFILMPRLEDQKKMIAFRLDEMEKERKRVLAIQEAVNARLAAFDAFTKDGRDALFFQELNRLLSDVREALRVTPIDLHTMEILTKVRGLRRELAAWAMAGQAHQPNGLVIVETLVVDEPCWFVVDTGAMDTLLSEEIVAAIGYGADLGKLTSLSVVGGMKVPGLAFRIPRLTVCGETKSDVPASAVSPSDVGIDGLLGQSFLKSFVYTIDERQPGKLILVRR